MAHNYTIESIRNIARADFLQRIRSYYFLIGLGGCIFLIYSFVPALDAGYTIVSMGNYRGLYNSAWIGGMVASCAPFFILIGFYVVNYAVKRDYDTGVGQIIATTRINSLQYLTGKFFSNFAVLLLMLAVIAIMTIVMFLVRGETTQPEFAKLLLPLLILTVPAMFITAALALFFDSLTGLGRGTINILYFFLWIFLAGSSLTHPFLDVFSINTVLLEIKHSITATHSDWNGDSGTGILIRGSLVDLKVFTWEGMSWTASLFLQRLIWMALAFGLVFLASVRFNRFDTAASSKGKLKSWRILKKKTGLLEEETIPPTLKLRDLPPPEARFSFRSVMLAELRLMVKGNTRLWLIVSSGLFITCLFTPVTFARHIALPLLWFFQILVLSKLGSREITYRCSGYIFSAASPLQRQLPAMFSAASLLMLMLAAPVFLRLLFAMDLYGVYAIAAGALFIPAFAIASGIITRGSKLFEVIFTIMVYGNFNGVFFFDLTGALEESQASGIANYYLGISGILIILAFFARKRQLLHA